MIIYRKKTDELIFLRWIKFVLGGKYAQLKEEMCSRKQSFSRSQFGFLQLTSIQMWLSHMPIISKISIN